MDLWTGLCLITLCLALLERVMTTNDLGVMFDTELSSLCIALMWQTRAKRVLICY